MPKARTTSLFLVFKLKLTLSIIKSMYTLMAADGFDCKGEKVHKLFV